MPEPQSQTIRERATGIEPAFSALGKSPLADFATWSVSQNWPSTRTFTSGSCRPVPPNFEPFAHESRTTRPSPGAYVGTRNMAVWPFRTVRNRSFPSLTSLS
jgi:hypothetical protein